MEVSFTTEKLVAATVPKATTVAAVNPEPVTLTEVPPAGGPNDGDNAVTAGPAT